MHMCFLAFSHQYLHHFTFQIHQRLFTDASAEVRGQNTGKKSHLNRGASSQPPGRESNIPLSHPGGAECIWEKKSIWLMMAKTVL